MPEPDPVTPPGRRQPVFVVYPRRDWFGREVWRWRLVAGNGEVVAGGEAHTREADAVRAANTVRDAAAAALIAVNRDG